MADIALTTAGRIELAEPGEQVTLTCGVDVGAGVPVYADANGNWALANSTDAAHSTAVFIALSAARKGQGLTAVRAGRVDGFAISALAFGAPVYLSDTGTVATTAGTVSVILGRVRPATANPIGTARDKVLALACPF